MTTARQPLVLLVADDRAVQHRLETLLELQRFRVMTANSVEAAITIHPSASSRRSDSRFSAHTRIGPGCGDLDAWRHPRHYLFRRTFGLGRTGTAPSPDATVPEAVFRAPAHRHASRNARPVVVSDLCSSRLSPFHFGLARRHWNENGWTYREFITGHGLCIDCVPKAHREKHATQTQDRLEV